MGLSRREKLLNWRVLVVEDDADSRELVERVLLMHGATVWTATNGEEGLAKLKELDPPPTLILSDLSMPRMDGWMLFKAVKDNPATAAIPVIALTAHAMVTDRQKVMEAGFHFYLTKPFSPVTLADDLIGALGQSSTPPPALSGSDGNQGGGQPVQNRPG